VDLCGATLERDGLVVVDDALAPAEVRRLATAVDRVWRGSCPPGEALHVLSFLPLDDAFVELVDHPRVLPLVLGALGGNVYVYHCHLDVHPPEQRPEPRWRWHQDGGRQNVDLPAPRPRLSVKAAYFLTDVRSPEHGPLWVLPGSHGHDTLERPANGAIHPPGAVPVLVRAGTAVVFDRRLWHARGDNTSAATRKALFYAYTYRWIRLRDAVEFEPERVRRLSPARRQLLGLDASPFGCWFPTPEEAPLAAPRG
jgi:ectoine hydroxylase